jgi:hypothetical protein
MLFFTFFLPFHLVLAKFTAFTISRITQKMKRKLKREKERIRGNENGSAVNIRSFFAFSLFHLSFSLFFFCFCFFVFIFIFILIYLIQAHFRALSITQLINASNHHSVQTMMAMQYNTVTGHWVAFKPYLSNVPDSMLDDKGR